MTALCPGPGNAHLCSNGACRSSGCMGRLPPVLAANLAVDHGLMEAIAHGVPARSGHWPHVRAEQLRLFPRCAATGLSAADGALLEAHHIEPFHLCVLVGRADLELDLRNLITLARCPIDAHLLLGHDDNFRKSDLDPFEAARIWAKKTEAEIRADPAWLARSNTARPVWSAWTDKMKADYLAYLNAKYPRAVVLPPHPLAA